MDKLDRYQEELERRHAFFAKPEPEAPRSDILPADYPVTIIGCVRGIDGWYRAGFDHNKQTIIPLPGQPLDVGSARLRPRTDKTNEFNTAEGRKQ